MSETEAALEFPCIFPIKALGKTCPELNNNVVEIVRRHVPGVTEAAVKTRPSKGGKYTAVTVIIEATSKAQLDAIYMELSDNPLIIMSL